MRFFLIIFFCLSAFVALAQPNGIKYSEKFPVPVLQNPQKYHKALESKFQTQKTPEFKPEKWNRPNSMVLENGYAQAEIKDPKKWISISQGKKITAVDIVFTDYPKDVEFWRTNYHELLANRLKALFEIAPDANRQEVQYKIVLQTNCRTEAEAKKLFHGLVIYYEESEENFTEEEEETNPQTPEEYSLEMLKYLEKNGYYRDSTIVNVLNRNPQWKNMLVVLDWTASMYGYSGQTILWHMNNLEERRIRYYAFFNDGDKKPLRAKQVGKTGGIYFTATDSFADVLHLMKEVQRNGTGGETEENDMEALMKAIERFPDAEEVVLIADNTSCIRDYELLSQINVPVRVILCGARSVINSQYLTLAYKTGGSLHNLKGDIYPRNLRVENNKIFLLGREYFVTADSLLIPNEFSSPFDCDPRFTSNDYYKKPERKKKKKGWLGRLLDKIF